MTADELSQYTSLLPYWTFGLATAGSFYAGMVWVGGHFRKEFKEELTRWLDGHYESTWSSQFCQLFDVVFGERHFSLTRFVRSALASVASVVLLYVLFAQVLGVLGTRTFGAMSLWQALVVALAVNIIADYISLIETRWLLDRFGRVESILGQIALLLADLVFTAAIICIFIYAYSWFFRPGDIPSPVEIIALFSAFSVFFYSTFLTSVWAWLYCLSAWFVRLFTRLGLRRLFDIQENPVKQIALVGAVLMMLVGMSLGPVLKPESSGFANAFDDFICRLDLEACFHAARITNDDGMTVHFMQSACGDEAEHGNCGERLKEQFPASFQMTNEIWRRACAGGYPRACNAYAYAFENGEGVAVDHGRAVMLYERACDDGYMRSCHNLGRKYEYGHGIDVDTKRAVALYEQACNGSYMPSCGILGRKYEYGQGVDLDLERAAALYELACDGGHMPSCNTLGSMYASGYGVAVDLERSVALFERACEGGEIWGCMDLGSMYEYGQGVAVDLMRAVALYEQACAGGDMRGCNNLGTMYEHGPAVDVDFERAAGLYEWACDGSNWRGCNNLGSMYEHGQGVVVDRSRAVALYERACERNLEPACLSAQRLSKMSEANGT